MVQYKPMLDIFIRKFDLKQRFPYVFRMSLHP